MTRVAAVDCGTNSVRLLVVDRTADGVVELVRRTEIVRLGEGVDRTGRLAPAALARARARLEEYAQECSRHGVERVRFATTSAARDADNAEDFLAIVRTAFAPWGTQPEVLTGEQEAALTFRGAVDAVRASGASGPFLVVDLGGGSTELVQGLDEVDAAVSLDIGAVRLHERLSPSDPPTSEDVDRVNAVVDAVLEPVAASLLRGVRTLVGVAGTSTTVTAHALGLERYDVDRVHLATMTPRRTVEAAREIARMPIEERLHVPGVVPGREDVIGAGALVWARIVERAEDAEIELVITSEHDLLDGLTASLEQHFRP